MNCRKRLTFLTALVALALAAQPGCRSKGAGTADSLVVVNAPVGGEVRRVLVSEGAPVSKDAVLIEIAVRTDEAVGADSRRDDPQASARAATRSTLQEVEAAEAEARRAAVEVERVGSLVASGAAPQSQLDAARAQYQQTQERLNRARERAQSAQANLTAQQSRGQPAADRPAEQVVVVRVPASGTVRVISVRAGQRVQAGQPIATVSAEK